MKLDRIDFFDIRQPDRLAKAIHTQMGDLVLPVPVEDIATALDISEVRTGSFDGFEGMLLTDQARSIGAILANTRGGFRRRGSRSRMNWGTSCWSITCCLRKRVSGVAHRT